jgi:hypothetical protein
VSFIHAIAGGGVDDAVDHQGRAGREIVWEHIGLGHEVVGPDHVAVNRARVLLVGHSVVAVFEAGHVEGGDVGLVRGVVEAITLDERRGADALLGPVVHAARGEFRRRHLPDEIAGLGIKGHDHTLVALDRRVAVALVVGADEDTAARNHRSRVTLRAGG